MENSVFNRGGGHDTMSESAYNGLIGLTLFYGFGLNWWIVSTFPFDAIPILPLIIGYFVSAIAGIFIAYGSDNPVVSFIGYNLVVVPVGFILNVGLQGYDQDIIINAIMVTAMVTGIMMVMGVMFPSFFRSIEGALFWALLAAIVAELFLIFVLGRDLEIMDWIVALIFCGYIGVDWGRAQAISKTPDNAIDSVVALYLDIINLFIRILSIMGNSDDWWMVWCQWQSNVPFWGRFGFLKLTQ